MSLINRLMFHQKISVLQNIAWKAFSSFEFEAFFAAITQTYFWGSQNPAISPWASIISLTTYEIIGNFEVVKCDT